VLNRLIGAFLVLRLELRQLPLDLESALSLWHRRTVIEIVLERRDGVSAEGDRLRRRLHEVYPF
jgi:hypothetical protein